MLVTLNRMRENDWIKVLVISQPSSSAGKKAQEACPIENVGLIEDGDLVVAGTLVGRLIPVR